MTVNKSPEEIKNMFDMIAESYDRNNNIISLGLHKLIKQLVIKQLKLETGYKILDICCGTGDIEEIIQDKITNSEIIGLDFSSKMLSVAKKRLELKKTQRNNIRFVEADATNLPFENNYFDVVTVTFGLRNIQDRTKAIKESYRVLKSQGQLLQMDFGIKNIFSLIFDMVVKSGIFIFYKNKKPYDYLISSKKEFPEPEILKEEFIDAGFKLKMRKEFLFGVISMQVYTK